MFPFLIPVLWTLGAAAIGALTAGALVCVFWSEIINSVSQWLRDHNYDTDEVMEALVKIDKIVVNVRNQWKATFTTSVRRRNSYEYDVLKREEKSFDDIDDKDLVAQMKKNKAKFMKIDILEQVQAA